MIHTGFPETGPTLGEVGEAGVIQAIVTAAPSTINGDDAAVLTPSTPNSRVVASTDMLVDGRHFSADYTTPFLVGRKAVVQNYADIEAMGARPLAALLAISAPPETPVAVVEELARGLGSMTQEWASELVGGDVTSGERLVISVTAIGSLGGNLDALRHDGAHVRGRHRPVFRGNQAGPPARRRWVALGRRPLGVGAHRRGGPCAHWHLRRLGTRRFPLHRHRESPTRSAD